MTDLTAKSDCAICYVTDETYLFPTIASALSLRAFVPPHRADVLLFLTGNPEQDVDRLHRHLDGLGITLARLDQHRIRELAAGKWRTSHISMAALGRFLIGEVVAQTHRRMLYVDGDTYFARDPRALLDHQIAAGSIGAADDALAYSRSDRGRIGRGAARYFADLGLPAHRRYFNSGVILAEAKTWERLAPAAIDFFVNNAAICRNDDQSAMNAALGEHRVTLPIRWNFQTQYENLGLARRVDPAIYHFTGSSKPWYGPLRPWQRVFPFYQEVERRIAHIVPRPTWPADRVEGQNAVTRRLYWKMHLMFAPRVIAKRRAILRAERAAERVFAEP